MEINMTDKWLISMVYVNNNNQLETCYMTHADYSRNSAGFSLWYVWKNEDDEVLTGDYSDWEECFYSIFKSYTILP